MAFELKITAQTVKRLFLVLLGAAAVTGAVLLVLAQLEPEDPFGGLLDEERYQAVFLGDGRVFFGHLRVANDEYYVLRDAYSVQQTPGEGEDAEPQREIFSRTDEVHGPEPRMLIAKDNVVAVENLRDDSQLAETIDSIREQDDDED